MERFVKGDVVVIPFPFSDLSIVKRRPAFVLANLVGDDLILCQITSQNKGDLYSLTLSWNDFASGRLHLDSHIRPNRIFTASKKIIQYRVGTANQIKISQVISRVISIMA